MLSDADRNKAADILMEAHKTKKQAVQLSTTYPGITIEDAYSISTIVHKRQVAAGRRLIGHKVGLTSKAMQIQQKVHEPVLGFLLASGEQPSGTRFQFADLINPGFENELCLTVGRTLRGPGVTNDQAQAAISRRFMA